MNPAVLVFPSFVAGSGALCYAVARVASPRGIARTAREEAETATARALLEHRVQFGRDEAERVPDALACAQACAAILHSHLLRDRAEYAAIEWAAYLGTWLGPTPILDWEDPQWLGLGFDIDAPIATILACLAASAGRARHERYEAGDRSTAQKLTVVIELLDEKLLDAMPGGDPVKALVHADRVRFNRLENELHGHPTAVLFAVTDRSAR